LKIIFDCLHETTLKVQSGEFGGEFSGRKAIISGGVDFSLPMQKGQIPLWSFFAGTGKSCGRFPRSGEMMTQRFNMGSFLSSGMEYGVEEDWFISESRIIR